MGDTELTDEQIAGLQKLTTALDALGDAIVKCRENGLEPADAFRAAGIPIPAMAAPMLNQLFKKPSPDQLQQV
jgi:hypothetical protein